MSSNCEACGAADSSTECGACSLVTYCSKDCQKKDWKGHKPICKLAAKILPSSDRLDLDPNDNEYAVNVDLCLEYAQKHMENLKHVRIYVDQDFLLEEEDITLHSDQPDLKFSSGPLSDLLQTRQLESINVGFGDCCWKYTSQITSSGRIYHPLADMSSLQSFCLINGVVDDMPAFCRSLPSQLKSLKLDYLFREGGEDLTSDDCRTLVQSVAGLDQLVHLSLADCQLRNDDVKVLLAGDHPNLRILKLPGCFSDHRSGSYLTDETLRTIAGSCPNLQAIDLDSQPVTPKGICELIKACAQLREASFSGIDIPLNLLEETLTHYSAGKLLVLTFGSMQTMNTPPASFSRVFEAMRGRVVFCHPFKGLITPAGVSQSLRVAYEETKRIVELASDAAEDPSIHNEWSSFF